MNLLPGAVESGVFRRAGLSMECSVGGSRELTLGIRPEDVEFSLMEQPGWTVARVWVTEDLGNETLIRLSLEGAFVTLRAPAGTRAEIDSAAWFRI